ncbi:MAG TPA: SGNH/GDSL hydrolase family protein [Solirubrobacterales bacterium]|nr:SGNH/GDSL hydrolase family protein [Solirubrobacterales bacterium]
MTLTPGAGAETGAHTVAVGRVTLASTGGRATLLIPVRYGIQFAGRVVKTDVTLSAPGKGEIAGLLLHDRLSSGRRQAPERRRGFTFVHRLDLGPAYASQLVEGLTVRVRSPNRLDVDGDGTVDIGGVSNWKGRLRAAPATTCSSTPRLRLRPGRRVSVPLPVCGEDRGWVLAAQPEHGRAHIHHGRLVYVAPRRFRGSDQIQLAGKPRRRHGAAASAAPVLSDVQVVVGSAAGVVVRALGDSVTAGFGYYSNGTPMTIGRLLGCRPPASEYDDACSSNSLNTSNKQKGPNYAPDYGLANNVSWAAQWANEHGITNYENVAVSGSEPGDWAPEGAFYETTKRIESEDPDYILMTVGANPLLSNMLFGVDNMGCAIYSEIVGGYSECIERAFGEVHLRERLAKLYADLVQRTDATIYLMQYHLSIPSTALAYSAVQIAEMGQLLNREIAAVAAEVNPQRLQVVAPPHFNVGIDITPVYPDGYSCSRFGYQVDGPSVQSTPAQDELEVLHPLSFCDGPADGGPPWVISGDTGIHPSATGYAQMASQVPAPVAP